MRTIDKTAVPMVAASLADQLRFAGKLTAEHLDEPDCEEMGELLRDFEAVAGLIGVDNSLRKRGGG